MSRSAFAQESGRWKVCDCKFPLKSGGSYCASVVAFMRRQHFPEVFCVWKQKLGHTVQWSVWVDGMMCLKTQMEGEQDALRIAKNPRGKR